MGKAQADAVEVGRCAVALRADGPGANRQYGHGKQQEKGGRRDACAQRMERGLGRGHGQVSSGCSIATAAIGVPMFVSGSMG
jgi:hypothetical protein